MTDFDDAPPPIPVEDPQRIEVLDLQVTGFTASLMEEGFSFHEIEDAMIRWVHRVRVELSKLQKRSP